MWKLLPLSRWKLDTAANTPSGSPELRIVGWCALLSVGPTRTDCPFWRAIRSRRASAASPSRAASRRAALARSYRPKSQLPLTEIERGFQTRGPDLTAAAVGPRLLERLTPVGQEHIGVDAGTRGSRAPQLVAEGVTGSERQFDQRHALTSRQAAAVAAVMTPRGQDAGPGDTLSRSFGPMEHDDRGRGRERRGFAPAGVAAQRGRRWPRLVDTGRKERACVPERRIAATLVDNDNDARADPSYVHRPVHGA